MSTRNISWGGKGGRCVGLTTLPPSCADCLASGSLNPLEPGPVQTCNGIALPSRNGMGGMDWIGVAQDRDRRRALVIAVMNLRVP
jgi:hypothetical protein